MRNRDWRRAQSDHDADVRPLSATLLLLAALGGGVGNSSSQAAEAQVATPFEVRKEAQELFDDLAKRGSAPTAEDAALLERVQQLMARHGDRLVEAPGAAGTALPLTEVLLGRLRDLGLSERFNSIYAPLAERRRAEVRANETELLTLTRSYPGTPTATATWRTLADRAWDSGRLGAYLQRAAMAGEAAAGQKPADSPRSQRSTQARNLLAVPSSTPPQTLIGAEEMWRQPLDLRATPAKASTRQPRNDTRGPVARIGLSKPLGDTICGSDGQRAFVIDYLVGRQQGALVAVGNSSLLRRQCIPAVLRDGFATVGVQDVQRVVLVALNLDGSVRWRAASPGMGFNPLVSAPVAVDQVVAVALVVADDDAADLRVQAYRQDNGHLAWDVLVARLAGHRPWMFNGDQAIALIPGLAVVDGRLLVLSNSGILARIGADGDLQRVWTYRAPGDNTADGIGNQQGAGRMGAIASDGITAVATPADLPGKALIISADQNPIIYRGDGANGEILALGGGRAYIAGSRLVAVDLAKQLAIWDSPVPGTGTVNALNADLQGVLGDKSLVIAGREAVAIYDPATGTQISRRGLERPIGISAGDQTLIAAADSGESGSSYVAAYGGAVSVVERLTTAAKADPKDVRSVVALAAIAAAREQVDEALGWYDEAFKRGAGNEYAQKAAKLLRRRLDLAIGEQWGPLLARFETIAKRDPTLSIEVTYWQARHAEAAGNRVQAATLYAQVASAPSSAALVVLRDGLALHLRTLAACGRARLDASIPLPWSTAASVTLPALTTSWQVAAKRGRGTVVGGGLVVGYADGVLTANRIGTGAEAWWRTPQRPLLGVRSRAEQAPADGIPVEIMPGTSAAAAGLLSDDVLLRFNGAEVHSFSTDLVPAVLALTVRSPFTAEVRRGERILTLHGTLGGEMVEPVAINERSVIVWPTTIGPGQQAIAAALPGTRPEGLWAAVHDLATGAELWRHAIPPATAEDSPARPLLTADDLVLLTDGGDLVALPAHPAKPHTAGAELEPIWRLAGQAPALRDARLIGGRLLWLPDLGHDQSQLVDGLTGVVLAYLPIDSAQAPLLLGSDLFARQDDGTLSCWDVGLGRLRWKVPGIARLAAAQGDTIWAVNTTGQLVSLDRFAGTTRRLYGDWVGVVDGRVALDVTSPASPTAAAHGGDRLYLHVTPTATTHALVCMSLAGGAVLWQQALPADIAGIEPTTEGVGCLLAGTRIEGVPPEPAVALAFDLQGNIVRVAELAGDPGLAQVRFLVGGLLLSEASGLRATPAEVPASPKPIASTTADDPALLNWQTAGSARYALEPKAPGKSYDLWVDTTTEDLRIRIGQLGPVVDQNGFLLTFPGNPDAVPVLPDILNAEAQAAVDGHRRWRVRIPATIFARSGLPWQIRAATASGSDCPPAPWWLRNAWRTVVNPKGAGE